MSKWKIKFKGEPFLLIGEKGEDGPICTQKQYDNFTLSYAHLFMDGKVRRLNEVIGSKEDIEYLEKID